MSSLDDPAMKKKYQKSKFRVKRWESDFMDKYGRKPNKNDIRSADLSIKESYKMYWKLKTQFLEETLLDITFTDEVQSNVSMNTSFNDLLTSEISFNAKPDDKENPVTPDKVTNVINTENIAPNPLTKEYSAVSPSKAEIANVDGAWGDHLNKDREEVPKKKSISIGRSTSFQLSQKKFNSRSFSKRNPRKSLSMVRSKSKSDVQSQEEANQSTEVNDKLLMHDPTSLFLGNGVKVVNQEPQVVSQSVNPIQEVLSGKILVTERKVDLDWVDRCSQYNDFETLRGNSQRLSGVSDSGIESIDAVPHEIHENASNCKDIAAESSGIISDDDFVCNSDTEEEESKNKRIRNWKRVLSDMSCQQVKRPRYDISHEDSTIKDYPVLGPQILERKSINNEYDNENVINRKDEHNLAGVKQKVDEYVLMEHEDNVTDQNVEEKVVKVEAKAGKKRRNSSKTKRKVKQSVSDDGDDDENDEDAEVKGKKGGKRIARSTNSKSTARQTKSSETKTRITKRVTRNTRNKNRKKDKSSDEAGDDLNTSTVEKGPEFPIYGIESLDVVPRFTVPQSSKGDLVTEFCASIAADSAEKPSTTTKAKAKSLMTPKEKLEAKIAAGKVNENFVRINLKKKIFVKGKKNFNFSRYKKNQWRNKKKELASGEGSLDLADLAEKNICFKCGGTNHMARKCPAMKSDELLPLEEVQVSDYPTLEEAKKMAAEEASKAHSNRVHLLPECSRGFSNENDTEKADTEENTEVDFDFDEEDFEDDDEQQESTQSAFSGHKIPKELIDKLLPPVNGVIEPLYPPSDDGAVVATPREVYAALKQFGHSSFRPGQEQAVMRILSGQSTLVTLSTGSGKSLCYQLPAYLYAKRSHCITLVISPLVSLMDDQVTGIPGFIAAGALHTGQSAKVREKIINTIKAGNLDILLVSPEAIVAGEKSSGFGSLLRQLPPIAFACIDEAHCISQWSDNFRPSYLVVCRVLTEKLGVKTILGLTATATKSTAESIVSHLKIHDGMNGVIRDTPVPNNLSLTVSKDEFRDRALIDLLKSPRFSSCDSIIIYCTRRDECIRIAGLLRVSLQNKEADNPKSKSVSPIAEAYHAGLAPSRRKVIQKAFMNGVTKVIAATVAFGMGINKSDIRSVIHYNMPNSFERYVQEVGRAGRDHLPAHCHLFLSPKNDADKWELKRHIYADGVDRHSIRKLLQKIFVPCSCGSKRKKCPGHEVAIPVEETVRALDVSEESISTLLCYLELHSKKFITVLSSVYVTAKVSSYNGPKALKAAAQISPPLAMAIALDRKKGISHDDDAVIEFPVVDVAAAIGWDSGVVKSHLKNLEWEIVNGKSKRSAISVRFDNLGLRVRAPGDLSDAELDEALDTLAERTQAQQSAALQQLQVIHTVLNKHSYKSIRDCNELNDDNIKKSEELKSLIRTYFQSSSPLSIIEIPEEKHQDRVVNESQIVSDIRSLICSYKDNNFSGRAVARIFHGIQSPNYSALTWSRCRFWRAHLAVDFNWIVQIATREILAMR